MTTHSIKRVEAGDLDELLALMRAYCDFYEVSPTDGDLLALAQALIRDPEQEGVQLLARDSGGQAAGFATVYWSWSTTNACRIGVMNDLFVAETARGQGVAEQLIEACRAECVRRGARRLGRQRPTTSALRLSTIESARPGSSGLTTGWTASSG